MSGEILFIAADPRECSGLVSHWDEIRPVHLPVLWAREGRLKARRVTAIANGVGAERAFAAVILASRPSVICNIGFCGALDESLGIGDVVVASEVRNGVRAYPALPLSGPGAHTGPLTSIDHVVQTALEKRNLRTTGASIVDMEAAGVARASEDLHLPFYCVRAVSDLAREDLLNDFNAALDAEGRFSVPKLISGALASPRARLAELLRLKQRTALASAKLGDFLADCTFQP